MFMSSPLYSHICDLSSLSPPQWAFRAIRATPRCATGKISCWTLTASRPSTPRLADPTITITTITTPRVSVRTSNRAWCELSCHCGLNRREATVKLHVRHMTTNQADIFEDLFLIFNFFFLKDSYQDVSCCPLLHVCLQHAAKYIFFIFLLHLTKLCNEGNEWRNSRGL